ncbi:MAG TPA: TetR/AcrR family transcriptional regulator [Solirubrobacteraceae bacterium]|nr:TetR/AcrR family transcriptional regulator [Solirubrobacteraceae bacterium]
MSAADRSAGRRARLMEAGLQLFGTEGYAGTSIRAVSATAGLNTRYFYESFSSREDLLYHVYEQIIREVTESVVEATAGASDTEQQAHEGLRVAWSILTGDPRKARVVALEVVAVSERLERLRRDNRHAFAELLLENTRLIHGYAIEPRLDPVLTARSLIGAVVETLVDWINDDLDATVEEIVDFFTKLFAAVARTAIAPAD